MIVIYSDIEPYIVLENGKIGGFLGNYLNKVAQNAQINLIWQNVPWDKQLLTLKKQQTLNICLAALYYTPERTEYLNFSEAIGIDSGAQIVAAPNNKKLLSYTTFSQAIKDPGLTPVVQANTTFGAYINRLLAEHRTLETEASTLRLLRSLLKSDDYYTVLPGTFAAIILKKYGMEKDLVVYDHFSDIHYKTPYFLACAKNMDKSLLGRLNSAIKKAGVVRNPNVQQQ